MMAEEFTGPRLFVDSRLQPESIVPLDRDQTNYLVNVLRMKEGERLLVFNGQDGEWLAGLRSSGRKQMILDIMCQTRPQPDAPDLVYLFAPLKHARLDYMAQKATEMGVSRLQPVITRHTQVSRVNLERMRANVIEAAEQCGILTIPDISPEQPLANTLDTLEPDRLLIFCDEHTPVANPVDALSDWRGSGRKAAILVGPEGGFASEEREMILRHQPVARLSLGPRILRADTAAVAVLAIVQSCLGDWV